MSDSDAGEKTEAPTGKRLSEARESGQIAKSPEFMTASFLLGSTVVLSMAGPTLWRFLLDSMGRGLATAGDAVHSDTGSIAIVQGQFWQLLAALGGVVCSMAVIAIAVQSAQTGGLLSTKPLEPKWSRLNPLNNIKRMVGVQSIIELTKAVLKLVIISWVVYLTLHKAWPDIQNLALQSPEALMTVVRKYGFGLLRNAGSMFLVLGLVDYVVQRWRTLDQLKMTKEQVKEEHKSAEGDQAIKGRRRAVARERLRRQMFANVRKADVVIVNPVHIAVALKYDTSVAPAPYVVAIGQRLIAKRIKELAFQHGVPVIENKPLARALLASAKVGSTIPVEMYLAVAEVLAFVMKQKERYGNAWRGDGRRMTSAAMPMAFSSASSRKGAEVGLAIAVVLILALIVVPLPPMLLDLCLAASIGLSLVVLLVSLYTTNPLDFSSFPALLLLLTLFRIALGVSSTRLILTHGHAGKVIEAFGQFVIGGNYAVGIVIFLLLIGINFIVITKGAGRIAEVSARFTLDAMPGKQMAIDADLSAGLIDEKQARQRRDEISRTADFYGAMDGASKYVKGDAVLGILIVVVNILGGIFIGVIQRGLPIAKAASTYTILTVGDGLVTQVPALIISTAAGLMVTSATGTERMGVVLATQLGAHPRAMWIVSGVLASFAIVPGLPMFPFLMLAGGAAMLARTAGKHEDQRMEMAIVADQPAIEAPAAADPMRDLLQIDPIELEVGYALIPLVDEGQGGDLLERISLLRKQAALELGILVPPIRIRDDIRLPANEYVIKLRGSEVARGEVLPRFLMALNTGGVVMEIDGMETVDPSFGMPARWIAGPRRTEAEAMGYVVVEPTTVVATHLMETLKTSAADLLGRQEVQEMVETLKKSHPALVEEIIPGKVSLSVLHRVLQRLLRERVPIRDLVTILEALGDGADTTKDPEALTEFVRRSLTNVIARMFADASGTVRGITIGARLESALLGLFSPRNAGGSVPLLTPDSLAGLLRDLNHLATTYAVDGRPMPLITPPSLRIGVRRLIEPVLPSLPVVSLAELPPAITLSSVATWEMPYAG